MGRGSQVPPLATAARAPFSHLVSLRVTQALVAVDLPSRIDCGGGVRACPPLASFIADSMHEDAELLRLVLGGRGTSRKLAALLLRHQELSITLLCLRHLT